MKTNISTYLIITFLFSITVILACKSNSSSFRSIYRDANTLMHETQNLRTKPFLKAHLKNGDVYVLTNAWTIDTLTQIVSGNGVTYDFNRQQISEGFISVPIDSVAIFESNQKLHGANGIGGLAILTGLDVVMTIICLTVPKACFGSCPTFYLNENDNFHYSNAESFSNAICPSMEYGDIDALNNDQPSNGRFSITMKNEALETHCVNEVKLLVYPRHAGERVYHSPQDDFYLCRNIILADQAQAAEGNVSSLLQYEDLNERFSFADDHNLNSREDIYLEFKDVNTTDPLGLIVSFRQTMMTTYFIYSAIGYMGDQVGDVFAGIENHPETRKKLAGGLKKELGKIDIYTWDSQKQDWVFQNGLYETGPIAVNKQLIPILNSSHESKVRVKMVLNKGLWRIDYVALTEIIKKINPLTVPADEILKKGKMDPEALRAMSDSTRYLISMPGDEYKFSFTLPEVECDYEIFLYAKGYYLEWMREHWIKDKDLSKFKEMMLNPSQYLKDEAANYKLYETSMEQEFWDSKIDTKTISYDEL
ncbi:MAG: hypothetical protein ABIQ02_00680 [Saprospiraceae bacterium]